MMTTKIIRLVHLISYLLVTSQMIFYLYIYSDALRLVSIETFLEQRKAVDSLSIRFSVIYYACLTISILAVVISAKYKSSAFFITSVTALVCLAIDIVFALKGDKPLNSIINSGQLSGDLTWEIVRMQWLNFLRIRGIFTTIGMISLLTGVIMAVKE